MAVANPEFKGWFAGSKVVDSEGNPLPMYHGSDCEKQFSKFYTKYGAYFSSSIDYAKGYMGHKGKLLTCYLAIKNPKVYNGDDVSQFEAYTGSRTASSDLVAQGYDGEIMLFADGEVEARITNPDQVRIEALSEAKIVVDKLLGIG